jgi:K+-sensing histidine kinase KdpD
MLKQQSFLSVYWVTLAIVILFCEYLAEPFIKFPILFLVPIALASWYSSRWWGIGLAVSMPLLHSYFLRADGVRESMAVTVIDDLIRITVLSLFAFLVDRTAKQTRLLAREARVLSGLLPICSFCKRIRDQDGGWHPLELYISEHSEALLSHSLCPECTKAHYGDRGRPL